MSKAAVKRGPGRPARDIPDAVRPQEEVLKLMKVIEGRKTPNIWKTPEKRRELFNLYCEHMAQGLSKDAFPHCEKKTLNTLFDRFPEEFTPEERALPEKLYRLYWELAGKAGMEGRIPGFNATTWVFSMKNRFNWADKTENKHDITMNLAQRMHAAEARVAERVIENGSDGCPSGETGRVQK